MGLHAELIKLALVALPRLGRIVRDKKDALSLMTMKMVVSVIQYVTCLAFEGYPGLCLHHL